MNEQSPSRLQCYQDFLWFGLVFISHAVKAFKSLAAMSNPKRSQSLR